MPRESTVEKGPDWMRAPRPSAAAFAAGEEVDGSGEKYVPVDARNRGGGAAAVDILIIEDEPLIALDLQYIVESLGHHVTFVARSRSEAVRAAAAQPPALIVADIQLADGSSGIQAVNEILESLTVPVILISAFPERLISGPIPEGARLLDKPINVRLVVAAIEGLLENPRKRSL